jgi:hypothetical protein
MKSISKFNVEEVEVTRGILGCDSFISWLYEGGDSLFKGPDGKIDSSKAFEVMKTSIECGVRSLDLSLPLVEVFNRLRKQSDERIEGLGAIQEWTCTNFTIDSVPLSEYAEEIKATMCSKLPRNFLEHPKVARPSFVRSFFLHRNSAKPLTASQIQRITMNSEFFEKKLEFYRHLDLKIVLYGGGTADWLVALGRTDLLEKLTHLIRRRGFIPILVCHWASLVLPRAEKELDTAGYVIPLNRLWSVLSLADVLNVIKGIRKPIIAMKPLARGALANDLEGAFEFLFKKAGVTAVLVGVSSVAEAKQTFQALRTVCG